MSAVPYLHPIPRLPIRTYYYHEVGRIVRFSGVLTAVSLVCIISGHGHVTRNEPPMYGWAHGGDLEGKLAVGARGDDGNGTGDTEIGIRFQRRRSAMEIKRWEPREDIPSRFPHIT